MSVRTRPPTLSEDSRRTKGTRAACRRVAAARPASPAPTTTTPVLVGSGVERVAAANGSGSRLVGEKAWQW